MKYQLVDWSTYLKHIQTICEFLQSRSYLSPQHHKLSYVAGIPRGGHVAAICISHHSDLTYLPNLPEQPIPSIQEVLLVDDILDTGNTLSPFISMGYTTITLYRRVGCKIKGLFFYCELVDPGIYVVFPYEKIPEGVY